MGNSQSYDLVQNDPKNREKTRKSLDETLPSSPCKTVSIHNTSSLRRPKRKREKKIEDGNEENISVDIEQSGPENAIDISPSTTSPTSCLSSPASTKNDIHLIRRSEELDNSPLDVPMRENSKSPCYDLTHDDHIESNVSTLNEAPSPQLSPALRMDGSDASPTSGYNPYDIVASDIELLDRVQELDSTPMIIQPVSTSTLEITIGPESKVNDGFAHGIEVIVPVQGTPESSETTPLPEHPSTSQDYPQLVTNVEVSPPEPLYRVPELPHEDLNLQRVYEAEEQQVSEILLDETEVPETVTPATPSTSNAIAPIEVLYRENELMKTSIKNHPIMENMDEHYKKNKEGKKRSRTKSNEIHPEPLEENKFMHTSALERDKSCEGLEPNVSVIVLQKLHREIPLPTIELDALPSQSTYGKLPVH